MNLKTIIIAGPTAAGKTDVAHRISKKYPSTIINADSMQVYKDFSILTNRPREKDLINYNCKIFGELSVDKKCNFGWWIKRAKEEIIKSRLVGKIPIVVGGTGLYLSGLEKEISEIPEIKEKVKKRIQDLHKKKGNQYFFRKLQKIDPETAKKLMAEAGYGKGFEMTIHGPNDRYINDAKIAEALAQMLSRIGIKAKVETMPKAVYFKRASRGGPNKSPEFSFMVLGWGAGSGEASSPLRALLHTYDKSIGMGRANRGRHSDPSVDKIIQEALATVDSDARGKLLAKATEIAVGKNYGVIPVHYQMNTWAAKSTCSYTPRTDERTIATYLNCK